MTSPPEADLGPFAPLAENLQEITEALAATTTQREVIEIVLTPAVQALGAVAGIVLFVDHTDQQMKIAGSQGYEDLSLTVWQEGPIDDHVLVADILRMREARYFEHAGALREAYPELERRTGTLAAIANATLPMFLDHRPLGVIVLDFKEPHHFTPAERRFLTILSSQCAVALGRAEATRMLEARVEERTRQLEEQTRRSQDEARAQEAFVAFTEAVGGETDLVELVQRAIRVLELRFPGVSVAYYEQDEALWKARIWSEDLRPDLAASLAAGLPTDTPLFAEVVQTRQPVFTDAWDATHEQIALTEDYGAVAGYPLMIEGELHSFLAVGLRETRTWSEADRSLVRAVGRGLNLALERTETARALTMRNAELYARTRALEAFAQLTHDLALTTDPLLLIGRAQEVVMSMLGDGAALYYEPEGDRWFNRVQHGSLHSPELQAAIDAGLDYGDTNSLLIPWTSGQPYFQDRYDQHTDQLPSLVGHIGATVALPLRVGNTPLGVMVFALFHQRAWSNEDRMLLEAAIQSLELALDRALQTRTVTDQRDALNARTQELAASTQELQAFSYSVSHDLRTPVRHMLGFLGLARKSLDGRLDDRSRRHLDVVEEAGKQMNTLIDAMLDLSRAVQEPLRPTTVDLNTIMAQLQETLVPDLLARNVQWEVAPLPCVHGDRDALRQVLSQLIENALKFTRTRDPAIIKVWAEDQGETWKVGVKDNGLGFDTRYVDRLFNLFQRLHTAKEASGSGVGLAQVKRLILKHSGQVFAEGQVDEGATFGFTLPKKSSPEL
ncbi:GAF domain-containing protein [Deinococcus altitudinis]|uniref:GAF domain-containing protein n=1 Tax=Deinococcus altitudinis TaxID=468914 RepID=UPI00389161D6